MTKIKFDYTKAGKFISKDEIAALDGAIQAAHNTLHNGTGRGSDFLGWVDLPETYDKEEFARIKKAAEKIKSNSKALIVIGIGGSYLGARMAVEMLHSSFANHNENGVQIYFAGNSISSSYLADLIEKVNAIKDIVLVNGDAWVMFVREAIEAMYMQYSAMDIKSMEYKYNRLVIYI